jgi:hypothetical protein
MALSKEVEKYLAAAAPCLHSNLFCIETFLAHKTKLCKKKQKYRIDTPKELGKKTFPSDSKCFLFFIFSLATAILKERRLEFHTFCMARILISLFNK